MTPEIDADTLPLLDILDATRYNIPSTGIVYVVLLITLAAKGCKAFV